MFAIPDTVVVVVVFVVVVAAVAVIVVLLSAGIVAAMDCEIDWCPLKEVVVALVALVVASAAPV